MLVFVYEYRRSEQKKSSFFKSSINILIGFAFFSSSIDFRILYNNRMDVSFYFVFSRVNFEQMYTVWCTRAAFRTSRHTSSNRVMQRTIEPSGISVNSQMDLNGMPTTEIKDHSGLKYLESCSFIRMNDHPGKEAICRFHVLARIVILKNTVDDDAYVSIEGSVCFLLKMYI